MSSCWCAASACSPFCGCGCAQRFRCCHIGMNNLRVENMRELVGRSGIITDISAYGAFAFGFLFIAGVGYIVLKDLSLMRDRQGRYLNYFFIHRRKEGWVLLSLWFASAILLATGAILAKL
ncbi:hypothetical protein MESS4_70011 [Mesorhizobium sp. STM 4661]|nr:hypothetical protein MESS4_70011 [Mesorhizobium sp. STM 4661]